MLEWVARFLPPGDLPDPGIEPASLKSPALAGKFFTTSTTWKAHITKHMGPNFEKIQVNPVRLLPAVSKHRIECAVLNENKMHVLKLHYFRWTSVFLTFIK